MVEQWTLDPLILVRIQVPQHEPEEVTSCFGFFVIYR
jgi:hypothetical protein